MTGRYGFRTGWVNLIGRGEDANDYFDPKKEKTFGHMMKEAGYATALAGKWQLAHFPDHPQHVKECGFDESCCWSWQLHGTRTSRYWKPSIWQNGKLRDDVSDKFGDDVFCDFLIDFIRRHKDQPFFAYYPMALVHEPHVPTPDNMKDYEGKVFDDAEVGDDKKARKGERAKKLFPGMVNYMDKTVGRLVAALDEMKLRENTIIIFTGDNGTDRSVVSKIGDMTIQGGKGTMTEFGTHVPMIVSWKGKITPGQVRDDLVDFSDVMPTMAEVTGAALPKNTTIDGKSFAGQLLNDKAPARSWIFTQLGRDRLVRDSRYMLHANGSMFEIGRDPFEKNDLKSSGDKAVVASRTALQAVLDKMK
jgi:arylsulfatase A